MRMKSPSTTTKSQGNLNMRIAHAHEIATQLVGMQLAVANLLAISVSATSIVAGCVTYAVINQPRAWPFWIVAGVIGCGLAVLIEGMTLGALIRIRLANKQIRTIVLKLETEHEAAITVGLKVKRFTSWRRKRDATRAYRKSRRYSLPLAFLGASASATAGGLFYHQVLGSLGTYPSLTISALFALIVTGTFVSSELFKDVQEEAVREGFRGGNLSEEALREETYRQTNQAVATEVTSYLASQDAKDVIKQAASHLLDTVLAELRQRSTERVSGLVTRVTDTTRSPERDMTPQQPAALLPPTGGVTTTGLPGQMPDEQGGMRDLGTTTEQEDNSMGNDTRAEERQQHAESQPNDRDAIEATDQPSGGARPQHLGIIEQMMLGALQKATVQEQATLQRLAVTQSLAMFTHTLQERYPTAASYLTEERVARVMAVFQAHNPQGESGQRDDTAANQAAAGVARLAAPQRQQSDNDKATRERASAPEPRGTARHDRSDTAGQATGHTEQQKTNELHLSEKTTVPLPPLEATGDLAAEHILAYLATHPGAKQTTVARVFGVSVRTIQRKLAAQLKPEP